MGSRPSRVTGSTGILDSTVPPPGVLSIMERLAQVWRTRWRTSGTLMARHRRARQGACLIHVALRRILGTALRAFGSKWDRPGAHRSGVLSRGQLSIGLRSTPWSMAKYPPTNEGTVGQHQRAPSGRKIAAQGNSRTGVIVAFCIHVPRSSSNRDHGPTGYVHNGCKLHDSV